MSADILVDARGTAVALELDLHVSPDDCAKLLRALDAEIVRLRGEVPYDRELIASILDVIQTGNPSGYRAEVIAEQAALLRAADNADAAGVRTASIAPAEAKGDVHSAIKWCVDNKTPMNTDWRAGWDACRAEYLAGAPGCGACGDGCVGRKGCRVAEESPHPADGGAVAFDGRGGSLWFDRDQWGIVVDALIEHASSSSKRKDGNTASNSDVRASICRDLIGKINSACAHTQPEQLISELEAMLADYPEDEDGKQPLFSAEKASLRSAIAHPAAAQVQQEVLDEPMRLVVALDFADNPRPYHSLMCPADTNGELYRALRTIAAAYRAAHPAGDALGAVKIDDAMIERIIDRATRRSSIDGMDGDSWDRLLVRAALEAALRPSAGEGKGVGRGS